MNYNEQPNTYGGKVTNASRWAQGQAGMKANLAGFLLAFATGAAGSETTIGRWCDRMIPNLPEYNRTMAIVITNDGKVMLKSKFSDGSSSINELREIMGNIYEQIGSDHGDKYRIVPSSGELQLLDEDGLIRVAGRLENTPQSKECSH